MAAGLLAGGATFASLFVLSVFGPILVGPASGFGVGLIAARVAKSRGLLPGIVGNVVAAAVLFALAQLVNWALGARPSDPPLTALRVLLTVFGVSTIFVIPGLLKGIAVWFVRCLRVPFSPE